MQSSPYKRTTVKPPLTTNSPQRLLYFVRALVERFDCNQLKEKSEEVHEEQQKDIGEI